MSNCPKEEERNDQRYGNECGQAVGAKVVRGTGGSGSIRVFDESGDVLVLVLDTMA